MQDKKKNNLACIYCGHKQKLCLVKKLFDKATSNRKCYACDRCGMSLQIYKTAYKFYRVINNSSRILHNYKMGKNRIPYENFRLLVNQEKNAAGSHAERDEPAVRY